MMEAAGGPPSLPPPQPDALTEKIKRKLLQKGVVRPTPKIIHTLRKKHLQKSLRKSKRLVASQSNEHRFRSLSESQQKMLAEEFYFQTISRKSKHITKTLASKPNNPTSSQMVGRPWERLEREKLRELASESKEFDVQNLKADHLRALGLIFEERKREALSLLLDDDVKSEEGMLSRRDYFPRQRSRRGDMVSIRFLVDRLCSAPGVTPKDWKFAKIMEQSNLRFTEAQMRNIVGELGDRGCWRHAMGVVEWVYNQKEHKFYKSRFVYTKLLAVLGKARRPHDALQIFQLMHGDCHIYPDMAAFHSIAVTLGQAGLLKELMNIVECMKQKPSEGIKNVYRRNWDPVLQPDVVVFNSVLNACIPSRQWKGVSWVFEQLRKGGIRPNAATYGLAMEVMLHARKYELVHELFWRMTKSGEVPQALTYKVLVKTFWQEDKVDEAIEAVRDMERRGIIGTASVYYELACCLCNKGRCKEAIKEIEKLKKLPYSKPLEVAFTGMIKSSMDGGHVNSCISIFEHMECPNIGATNAMLEVYGRNDMFSEAKELFEKTKLMPGTCSNSTNRPFSSDIHTYVSMLKACARAQHWEYFEYVYKEMALYGYQLHQSKHTWLLVEASKAGKWHLLEHAFDAILEAGEIPHASLFTEMVCQTASKGDYVGAATIINAMAHAPFTLTWKEWSNLFEENRDRISQVCLGRLLNVLSDSDMAKEATVSNLLRSLRSLCCSASIKELPAANTSIGVGSTNDSQKVNDGDDFIVDVHEVKIGAKDLSSVGVNLRHLHGHGSFAHSTILDRWPYDIDDNFDVDTCYWHSLFSPDVGSDNSLDGSGGTYMDDSEVSDLPSTVNILEAWRESIKKDGRGIIFPFYTG